MSDVVAVLRKATGNKGAAITWKVVQEEMWKDQPSISTAAVKSMIDLCNTVPNERIKEFEANVNELVDMSSAVFPLEACKAAGAVAEPSKEGQGIPHVRLLFVWLALRTDAKGRPLCAMNMKVGPKYTAIPAQLSKIQSLLEELLSDVLKDSPSDTVTKAYEFFGQDCMLHLRGGKPKAGTISLALEQVRKDIAGQREHEWLVQAMADAEDEEDATAKGGEQTGAGAKSSVDPVPESKPPHFKANDRIVFIETTNYYTTTKPKDAPKLGRKRGAAKGGGVLEMHVIKNGAKGVFVGWQDVKKNVATVRLDSGELVNIEAAPLAIDDTFVPVPSGTSSSSGIGEGAHVQVAVPVVGGETVNADVAAPPGKKAKVGSGAAKGAAEPTQATEQEVEAHFKRLGITQDKYVICRPHYTEFTEEPNTVDNLERAVFLANIAKLTDVVAARYKEVIVCDAGHMD